MEVIHPSRHGRLPVLPDASQRKRTDRGRTDSLDGFLPTSQKKGPEGWPSPQLRRFSRGEGSGVWLVRHRREQSRGGHGMEDEEGRDMMMSVGCSNESPKRDSY